MTSPIPIIVLDTNVVSELLRPTPEAAVIAWVARQDRRRLFITTIVEAELRGGAANTPDLERRYRLTRIVDAVIDAYFDDRILPFDSVAAYAYADILADRGSPIRRPIIRADMMIAAIARSYGAAVATRNVRDFADCGVPLINPWEMGGSV